MLSIKQFIAWREVGPFLQEIERIHMKDIDRDGFDESDKRRRLIDKWEDLNGDEATYDVLITAMLRAKEKEDATKVCKLLDQGIVHF